MTFRFAFVGMVTVGLLGALSFAQVQDAPVSEEAEGDELDALLRELGDTEALQPGPGPADEAGVEPVEEVVAIRPTDPSSTDEAAIDPNTGDPLADVANAEEAGPPVFVPREAFIARKAATLRGLDKITGRYTDLEIKADEPLTFGTLEITLRACYDTPPELPTEAATFLQIRSIRPMAPESMPLKVAERLEGQPEDSESVLRPVVFSGWMYASSPGLSALEHPVYDIWVMNCKAS